MRASYAKAHGGGPRISAARTGSARRSGRRPTSAGPLVIGGVDDLVAVARQIHLRSMAPSAPFVVCGDRREADSSVRVTADHEDVVPGLRPRSPDDLQRIVAGYAADTIRELDASHASFTRANCDWVVDHEARSLAEIEIATLRIVACNDAGNPHRAAARLGLSHVALGKWLKRRGLAR